MEIKKLILGLVVLALMVFSCEETEKFPPPYDIGIQNVTGGAFLKTVALTSSSVNLFDIANSTFDVTLEHNDSQNGTLLQDVDVYLSFTDNTTEVIDNSVGEQLYQTIDASSFSAGNKPTFNYVDPTPSALMFLGLDEDDLDGTDILSYRFVVNLTDGQSFTNTNNNANIATEQNYNSPFLYNSSVVCPVDATAFVGTYILNNITPGIFGDTWGSDVEVTLSVGDSPTQRVFEAVYLPQFAIGNGPRAFVMDLICGQLIIPSGQATGLACVNSITLGPPRNIPVATFDVNDDSVLTFNFFEDEDEDCAPGADVTAELVKL